MPRSKQIQLKVILLVNSSGNSHRNTSILFQNNFGIINYIWQLQRSSSTSQLCLPVLIFCLNLTLCHFFKNGLKLRNQQYFFFLVNASIGINCPCLKRETIKIISKKITVQFLDNFNDEPANGLAQRKKCQKMTEKFRCVSDWHFLDKKVSKCSHSVLKLI